ncbi:MAG: phage tail sheath C-terminal domain-containing protein [Acidobacteriota bacterium]|nr:phage tail sheath C-terminal domain-containing protein [Acidobacteriota bacterium]
MSIPPDSRNKTAPGWDTSNTVYAQAMQYCAKRRAMLILDPPQAWADKAETGQIQAIKLADLGNFGPEARNAAVYFPRIVKPDPMLNGHPEVFAASGMIAGIMSRTDVSRGVWKAPAGTEAGLSGIQGLEVKLTDDQNGMLNPYGINCLRTFPVIGSVVWGARTMRGADQLADDYKYVPVRRLTLYIEESLYRGTQWAVFEPNDATLWNELRKSVDGFMADLMRQGAFYSYEVICDKSTTTVRDIDLGIVNIVVAFAPVRPAEFVVIKIQQQAVTV